MNQLQKNQIWLACYIYYKNQADELLVEKVLPIIKSVMEKKLAEHFFFIRYHDSKGPHIRLRFKGDKKILEDTVKPLLQSSFPKSRFVRYDREWDRYGGENGILIAEKFFELSSITTLSILEEREQYTYDSSLGTALQLSLSFAHAVGIDKKEAILFFDHLSGTGNKSEFEKALEKHKDALLPYLSNIWQMLNQTVVFDKGWFNEWIYGITDIGNELKKAYKENQLHPVDPHNTHKPNPLWYFYESYIHMSNNRLGIYNPDEPYIAYIIKQALEYEK
ncbi:MAG TPA: thiopeptide-type bacteriocin biosynthesis protein [Candidatus Saccharimonadales bacterium]|nr:thiopeptide-type bacteriocin biosynthesis protein [Candidatus Saccharimonadales bacterium]